MKKNRSLICLLGWRSSAVENVPWQMLLDLVNCLQSSGWGERLSPLPGPRKPPFTPLGPLMSARLPWAVICSLETKKKMRRVSGLKAPLAGLPLVTNSQSLNL